MVALTDDGDIIFGRMCCLSSLGAPVLGSHYPLDDRRASLGNSILSSHAACLENASSSRDFESQNQAIPISKCTFQLLVHNLTSGFSRAKTGDKSVSLVPDICQFPLEGFSADG
jgi:hypothetical protein